MYRRSTHAGATSRTAVRLALAAALAGGVALGGTTPAIAKDKQEKAETGNSKAFIAAYAPLQAIINNPAGDFAAAKAMVPAVQATIQNGYDKSTFGLALVTLGTKLNDAALQKQGLQLALQSGVASAAQAGAYQFFLGKFDYDAKNYAQARAEFEAAVKAGYTQNDPRPAIAETYFSSGQPAEGLAYLSGAIKQEQAAGRSVPSEWLLRGLQIAYNAKLAAQATDYATMLVASDPTPKNWQAALQVINAVAGTDANGQLDVLRLMRETGSLKEQQDFMRYIYAADPMKLSHEAVAVIDEGIKSGALNASDANLQKLKATGEGRAAANEAAADSIADDARKAATGKIAIAAGDQYLSQGAYAKSAEMYQLAVTKGGADSDLARIRLGIADVKQGQAAAAKAALQQVTGPRAPVAKMWLAYIDSRNAGPTPPQQAAPPANGA